MEEGLTEMLDFVEKKPTVDVLNSEMTTREFEEVLEQYIVAVAFLCLDSEHCRDILKAYLWRRMSKVSYICNI